MLKIKTINMSKIIIIIKIIAECIITHKPLKD